MKDPFLKYSPFSGHENVFLKHSHEVLVSFLVYQFFLYPVLAPAVNKRIFRQHYLGAEYRVRLNYDIHTVSMLQAVLCIVLIRPLLFFPTALPVFGFYDEYASMVAAVMLGYFLWDLYVCVKYIAFFGVGFLGHALGSLTVTACSLMPAFQPWIGKFLVFEASTPFVNVNWYITQLSRKTTRAVVPGWFMVLNGLLLLATFFCARIVWGLVATVLFDYQIWKQWDANTPTTVALLVPAINLLMTLLNFYWFTKMLRIARKMISASKRVAKVA